jgi:inositol oxygenase
MRDYANAPEHVRTFYRQQHGLQTLEFVLAQKAKFYPLNRLKLGAWEMLKRLDGLRDESDPDTALSQMQHALQTAHAVRRHGNLPRWFILTALIHDLGKALTLFGEPQWAVVGDTFPVGCAYSDKIPFHEFFAYNPDSKVERYQDRFGIYGKVCGLDNVHFSWGHDEYLYQVVRPYLPPEALAIIRYHSAYAIHQDGAYRHLMSRTDLGRRMPWVRAFQKFDLYSKDDEPVDAVRARPYYQELIAEYLPPVLQW